MGADAHSADPAESGTDTMTAGRTGCKPHPTVAIGHSSLDPEHSRGRDRRRIVARPDSPPASEHAETVHPVFRTADLASHPTGVLAVGVHEMARAQGRASAAALARESPAGRLDAATRGALSA